MAARATLKPVAVRASLDRKSRRIETAVHRAAAGKQLVLAVSGGRDSMALLHATSRAAPESVAMVATFDHGTGPAATAAAALVVSEASRLGLRVSIGRATHPSTTEAEWREARGRFLRRVARDTGAVVATAHTRDDQIETVLMRILRDAGARGLAGLYAGSDLVRPLLDCTRADVAAYAAATSARIPWIDDPTNDSMQFLRNRVRRDLLPALTAARPQLPDELIDVATRAATWRAEVDGFVERNLRLEPAAACLAVAADDLRGYSRAELAILWPAIAARIGHVMDRRGTERAAAFTNNSHAGARIQLSGGWEISRTRDRFELRRVVRRVPSEGGRVLASGMRWDGWRFDSIRDADGAGASAWVAQLPANVPLTVRRWQPGDRMRLGGSGATRKVKRFLSDARVSGAQRESWPVVLAGDEIVWIPGVRRSDAAAVRPGRPGVLYRCELDDR
jgi:tRNA(Ile)-lysidine synthase